jgi:xanthine dehydrogenase accessory factor
MIDLINDFESQLDQGSVFALATVIETWRSAPRSEGASMMVLSDGTMIGSVSGGCVESTVVKEAIEMMESGAKAKRLSFGVTDEDAWSVGLSCGGKIDLWLEIVKDHPVWRKLIAQVGSNSGCVLVNGLEQHYGAISIFTEEGLEGALEAHDISEVCKQAYAQHKTQIYEDYFLNVFPSKSRLVIIGAAHVTLDLIRLAHTFNFETIVIDPRGIFTKEERFGVKPHRIYSDWPAEILPRIKLDSDTYVVVLTHDPKIDDQALKIVLETDVAYVGALGSKKTHAKRTLRLKDAGVAEEQIEQIYGPVGLNINARQPAEIALSIMAQIIGVKNQHL